MKEGPVHRRSPAARLTLSAAAALLAAGTVGWLNCQPGDSCVVGTSQCACTEAGACDPGLGCGFSQEAGGMRCLQPDSAGSTSGQPGAGNGPGQAGPGPAVLGRSDRFEGLWGGAERDFLTHTYFLFAPDGRVVIGQPRFRPDGSVDFEGSAAQHGTGRHRVDGNTLVVTGPDGQERTFDIQRPAGGGLYFGAYLRQFRPHASCPLRTFDGTFEWKYTVTSGVASPDGTVATLHRYTGLAVDAGGGFSYENVGQVSGVVTDGYGSVTGGAGSTQTSKGKGRYQIQGSYLTLAFDDGRKLVDLFQCYDADGKLFSWGNKVFGLDSFP
jgi:hypothetical protein